ncbi:MAG TPA: bifunctional folylpolyglutamate synthase/dihydrofolate synthase [Clostridiaceae bacterium]|nr:bifunctional folylpolyglutamate synthase/dihydrofolate synthase [Clostridiaceae bacterium]
MTYEEALEYIHGTYKFGVKLGLENIRRLLEMLGNPHKELKYVHVAGTNGKGSTVTFISSILIESGYKVGIYTSPYVERFTERICINGKEIPEEDLARITEIVKEKVTEMVEQGYNHPTEFEIITAIAFQYFYEQNCDIVVLEVGLGGRYDSTNIIDTPLVSVITSISFDHMKFLGNTLTQIAREKAGIIKENGNVVLYPQSEEVEKVIEEAAAQTHSRLFKADFNTIKLKSFGIDGQIFDYSTFLDLKIKLLGRHQLKNAAVAITACQLLKEEMKNITDETIRQGIAKARWKGRMELMCKDPVFFIDGAHNEDGVKVMVDTLEEYFPQNRKIFIMGVLKDKEYTKMVKTVAQIAYKFYTVTPLSDRALSSNELAAIIKMYCDNVVICDKIIEGVEKAVNEAQENDVICAFGSLYYIGEVREYFKKFPKGVVSFD